MGIFGSSKDKSPQDASLQVLAYLEDAHRQRSPFVLKGPGKAECAASVHSVNEDGRTFRLLPDRDFKLEKGAKVDFTFIHDGLRMGGATRAAETREGVVVLAFPTGLALMERRRLPRARLNPKEGATLTALQNLFEGVGINSTLENVSEGGAKVKVERAIAVATEKRMVLGTSLVPPGQAFMVLKLNKIPRCPGVLETAGKAVYLTHDGTDLMMGFSFDKPAQEVEAALRRLVAARAKPIPDALPTKVRRPKEPEPEPEPEPVRAPGSGKAKAGALEVVQGAPEEAAAALAPASAQAALEVVQDLPSAIEVESLSLPDPSLLPTGSERRTHLRLSLGPGYRARFQAGGTPPFDADLLDVSVGGCCLRVSPEGCQALDAGTSLEGFHFLRKELPNGTLPAQVSWILGKNAMSRPGPTEGRYVLVGVRFGDLPQEILEGLEAYIAWNIKLD